MALIDLGKLRFFFAGDYDNSTNYELNDVVKYGGNVYVYINPVKASGNLPTNTSYWSLMVKGFNFIGVFSTATAYKVGDAVAHGGKVYVAIADNTNQTPPNATYWSQFVDGVQFEGAYSGATLYQKNDLVTYGGSLYIAKQDVTNVLPSDTSKWDKFVEGISPKGVYNAATAYVLNDIVAYGGSLYKALGNTTGNAPTNATYWSKYLGGVSVKGDWVTSTAYKVDEVVYRGGTSYICILDHTSGTFATDLATKWTKFNGGIRYVGTWATATAYLKDDIVFDGISTYIVLLDHTSSAALATDVTASKLALLAKGSGTVPIPDAGSAGKIVTNNGTVASWTDVVAGLRESVLTGLTAAGSTQGTALQLSADCSVISTLTAGTADGVLLPTAAAGLIITVINNATDVLKVYPKTGSKIDILSANLPFSVYPNTAIVFEAVNTTDWKILSVSVTNDPTLVKSSAFTASTGIVYACDTTTAAFNVTLPASPVLGDYFTILDAAGNFATNKVTVLSGTQKIMGTVDDLVFDIPNCSIRLLYVNSTVGWRIS